MSLANWLDNRFDRAQNPENQERLLSTNREENARATDETILHLAVEQERLVVTMDKDFSELVYRSGKSHKGVLLLRLEDQNQQTKIDVISRILDSYSAELVEHFSVYQNGQLRIRK